MAFIQINQATCSKCGACADICPDGLFVFEKGKFPYAVEDAEKFCIRCGHCVGVCPKDAITHREQPLEKCPKIKAFPGITFEQCDALIRGRRSIREFLDKPVPKEIIEKLLDSARYAPTGGNGQEVRWMVFDKPEDMRRLSAIGADWIRASANDNPYMAERRQRLIKYLDSGRDGFLRGAPALIVAYSPKEGPGGAVNSSIAIAYLELLADSMGLGCCWAGFFMFASKAFPAMIKAINMPEGFQVDGAIMVGYPKYSYRRIPARKPSRIIWK
ncbi:MAG TPA: nitroreductase family protein [Dehalococcoidales bacterium]|nr:nitroreductase family protein [Dehalococcoidales bacterium]